MIKTVNENDNEKVTLAIEGDLNIYSVNELKNGILESLNPGGDRLRDAARGGRSGACRCCGLRGGGG